MRSRSPLLDWTAAPEGEGEWRCPYCGAVMPDGVDDPSVWAHCGEVGHAEHWHMEWTPRKGMGAAKWVKSDSDARYGEE